MKRLFGIVSSDVVDSTSLERAAILQLRRDIYNNLFCDLSELHPSFWGRVVRGDTIECCNSQAQYSFRMALLKVLDEKLGRVKWGLSRYATFWSEMLHRNRDNAYSRQRRRSFRW